MGQAHHCLPETALVTDLSWKLVTDLSWKIIWQHFYKGLEKDDIQRRYSLQSLVISSVLKNIRSLISMLCFLHKYK